MRADSCDSLVPTERVDRVLVLQYLPVFLGIVQY